VELATTAASVKVVLVLDTSSSVAGRKLEDLKTACRAVFHALRPSDSAALLTFSERVLMQVREENGANRLDASLDGVQASGRTAMLDALYAGLSLAAPDTSRTLLILFSDGVDNASFLSEPFLLEALKQPSVIVYAVDATGTVQTTQFLDQIADTSGGERIAASASDRLATLFVNVLSQFRSRYLLTYTAKGVARNDGWHTLKVRLKLRKGSVKARAGYFSR
jgi:VWFA-related protein